jgi:hypothetical protein
MIDLFATRYKMSNTLTRYFHVNHDRTEFATNKAIELRPFRGPSNPPPQDASYWQDLENKVNGLLPAGISIWGQKVFACILDDDFMLKREHVCEEIRQKEFPQCPSRLQALFCCGNLEEARAYRREWDCQTASIWTVESANVFRADMRWMSRCEERELAVRMRKYWSQELSSEPLWEYLLIPPLVIQECVCDGELDDRT